MIRSDKKPNDLILLFVHVIRWKIYTCDISDHIFQMFLRVESCWSRMEPKINLFSEVVADLVANTEVNITSRYDLERKMVL